MPDIPAARAFIRAHARILDQRRAIALLDGGPTDAVVAAVLAYRNPDGGFGHGLEPDTRDPASQPLYAQVALEAVGSVDAHLPDDVTASLCDHLAGVADRAGALPIMFPSFADHPRASHWQEVTSFPPGLNPTAAIAGLLHGQQVRHAWLDDATAWCLDAIAAGVEGNAHVHLCALTLLTHLPDRATAERLAPQVLTALVDAPDYRADPDDPEYGLTPLDIAPRPDSTWRSWFDADLVAAHLDALASEQQPDGGWPIRWEPPTEPSVWEWRGMVTVDALDRLRHHRVDP
ncbi:hypothetical protein [Actinomarinicola tropica]|uniref:Prenyltransferase n=1 Tax=Actinomarinicola tropica TaxID=2789776 RepID=A0A5Q2RBQ8_9ACTN|nr:hypothetical protein [Actinomarinicola tropica]QGG94309.1 hypothetical protein GH723_03895 [Actinomarinicola tropica]